MLTECVLVPAKQRTLDSRRSVVFDDAFHVQAKKN